MHADNRGVYHLNNCVMGSGKRVDDAAPDTNPLVACGVRTKHLG